MSQQLTHVIIDTDADIDDWMATLFLLNYPHIQVDGLTVVGTGAAHLDPGTQNMLNLLQLAGQPDIPVAKGLGKPMRYNHTFPESIREPIDQVYGIELPHNPNSALPNAVDFLYEKLTTSKHKYSILAIGPLTNLGTLLKNHPEAADGIEEIVIMGGAIEVPGNVHNADPSIPNIVAEWNIYIDPVAADYVLQSGVNLKFVPLDCSQTAPITKNFYYRLLENQKTASSTFVYEALTKDFDFLASGNFYFWDPLAAALLADPSLGTAIELHLDIITTDNDRCGQILTRKSGPKAHVYFNTNALAYEDLFLASLNRAKTPRDYISFVLDGELVETRDESPQTVLVDYLHRTDVGKTGTKKSCGQGGCGACTVMMTVYDPDQEKLVQKAVNSCLRPIVSLDGTMITTTQGIGNVKEGVDTCQFHIAANNGSQCGYCTPGFTMNMFAKLQDPNKPTELEVEEIFDGNICRCTGYRPILEGFKKLASDYTPPHNSPEIKIDPTYEPVISPPPEKVIKPSATFLSYMKNPQPLNISKDGFNYIRPVTLPDLLKIKAAQGPTGSTFRLICGNTAVGIYPDKPNYEEAVLNPTTWVDVSVIPELQQVTFEEEGIRVGGQITISRLMEILKLQIASQAEAKTRGLAALLNHLKQVANTQIRNEGTLAGNVYIGTNQGFLSDLVLVLGALGARVHVATLKDIDSVYDILELPKDGELPPEAVYKSIFIPYTNDEDHVYSYKIRRRKDDCHAIVNAAFKVSIQKGLVADSTLVVNGIKAEATPLGIMFHPIRLSETSEGMLGKPWNEDTLNSALATLIQEVEAHDPKLGLIDQIPFAYRKSLAENLFYKFYVEVALATGVPVDPNIADSIPPDAPVVSRGEQFYNSYPEEAPVSEPYIKLSAFMQATGEATYTKANGLPPFTAEAAFVYSLHPRGRFNYVLPITSAHGRKGERVTAAQLAEFLKDWNKDFVDLVTYADIPNPSSNWVGLGGDDPIFVPSKDDVIPEDIKQKGAGSKYRVDDSFYFYFEPSKFTCIGAPLALVIANDHVKAREIAIYVRNNCIDWDLDAPEFFQEALKEKHFFPQNPDTSPGLTHLEDITRPGTKSAEIEGTVKGEHKTGYQNHFYMETMNTVAIPDENKSMILFTATQNLADNQNVAANALGIQANRVKVTLSREGGGFGGRQTRSRFNSTACAVAAWKLNRPIHLDMDRETNFIMCGNRHPFEGKYHSKFSADGKITGLEINYFSNGGNTYDMSFPVLDLAVMTADNTYNIPNFKVTGEVVRTNEISNTAFRSFGMVQGINILEEAIEHTAFEAGIDPEDFRENNFYRTGTIEWTEFQVTDQTIGALEVFGMDKKMIAEVKKLQENGKVYKNEQEFADAVNAVLPGISLADMITLKDYATLSWDYTPFMQALKWCNIQRLWDDLKKKSDFDARKQKIVDFNSANRWKKRGICMIPLKYGVSYTGPRGTLDQGGAYVIAYADDGSVLVHHGGVEIGQGIDTKMAQIAAETLGIDLTLIRIANTDTQSISDASPTAASTGSDLNGGAVQLACQELRDRLTKFCEDLEQYTLYFSEYDGSSVDPSTAQQIDTVVRNWRSHWSECWPMIISLAYVNRINLSAEARYKSPHYSVVDVNHRFGRPFFYFTYAAAASEVEVDILTGEFTIIQSDILFDVGKSLNPLIDIGQIEGGFVQGVGYVTTEELLKQQDGEAEVPGVPNGAITSVNTWQYKPPGAKTIPQQFNVHIFDNSGMESKSRNPHLDSAAVKSSKGIGEPPLVLGNTVFFAIKRAILAFYQQQGHAEWCDMTAPATIAKIQSACQVAIKKEDLVL